jgi:hypothetical protein
MNISDENNEKVIQFMSIASLEYDVAMVLMNEAKFNLDQAINNFFSSLSAHETKPVSLPKKSNYDQDEDYVPPLESLPKPKIMRLVDHYYEDEGLYPPSIGAFDQNAVKVEPFRNFKEEKLNKTGKPATLASLFRPPFEICFEESYDKAMAHGTKHRKYLIINIQDIGVFDCQRLNRDTWSDITLKTYIKNNFIFWQRTKEMAVKFCQYYSPQELPHISILDPRTGEKLDTWEGFMTAPEMLNILKKFLSNHPFDPESIEINGSPLKIIKTKEPVKKAVVKHISDLTEEEQMEEIIKISLLESQENEEKEEEDDDEDEKKKIRKSKKNIIKAESDKLKRKEVSDTILFDDGSQPRKKTKYIEIDEEENNNNSKNVNNGTKGPILIEEDNPIYEISEDFLTLSGGEQEGIINMDQEEENENECEENEKETIEIENKIEDNKILETKLEENIPEVNCTLKIRLPNGKFLSQNFISTCSLFKVHQWIRQERSDIEDKKRKEACFNLLSGHPSKLYTEQECKNLSLHHAGLVPRGVIFVENV